jgi:hypothetical protein
VSVPTEAGDIPVAQLHDGDFLGEIAICATPADCNSNCKQRAEDLAHSQGAVLPVDASVPEMAIEMTRLLAERLTRTTAELVEAQRARVAST